MIENITKFKFNRLLKDIYLEESTNFPQNGFPEGVKPNIGVSLHGGIVFKAQIPGVINKLIKAIDGETVTAKFYEDDGITVKNEVEYSDTDPELENIPFGLGGKSIDDILNEKVAKDMNFGSVDELKAAFKEFLQAELEATKNPPAAARG